MPYALILNTTQRKSLEDLTGSLLKSLTSKRKYYTQIEEGQTQKHCLPIKSDGN